MNNPLEAVTQAVNSLVTALKLPDESAKANEVLGEMSFPQFSRLLPYRDYNQESGLFMNDTTMGFMLEAIPINGANESIVEALDHMLRTKLPRGIPLCIHLMSSQLVGDRIEYGLREFSWSGEQAERFNAITRAYYMKAAATQFPLPEGMNLPLTLRHYRVFISYCSPSKKKSRADILEMENLVKIIRASFHGAKITTQTVDAQAFIEIVGEMINHNPDSLYPKRRQLDPYSDLNYQCVEDSFDLKVRADYLTLGLRENGRNSTARILNFHLARNPEIAFLWNMADNYSNLLNPEMSISCPFILTLTLVVEDQVKTHSEANLKYMDLEKKSKTSYAKWFPSVEKEAKEWGELRQRLGSGQSSVVSYFLNITAFCKDNNETALEVEQDILNSFRKNGFELISPRFNHMRNFLTCLPFMAGKGLFKQLKEAGVVQRAESFNVANLMPLVADALYFVSFSIPEEGLKRMLGETRHYGIPATLRGMVNNDLKTTAEAVLSLVKDGATDGVQIDPTLFSQYGIRSVPALVVFCSQGYDIIRGNLRVGQALEKVAATGDCRQVAHDLLAGKGDSGK